LFSGKIADSLRESFDSMKKITLLEEREKLYSKINEIKEYKFHSDLLLEEWRVLKFVSFISALTVFDILLGGNDFFRFLIFIFILFKVFFGFVIGIADLTYHLKAKRKFTIKRGIRKDIRFFLPNLYTLLFFAFLHFVKPFSFFDIPKIYHLELFFLAFILFHFFNYRKTIYHFVSEKMKNKKDEESLDIKIKAIDKEILKDPDLCLYILENKYHIPSYKEIFDNLDRKAYLISHFKTKTTKKENEIETL
jgi:hypothetical protein